MEKKTPKLQRKIPANVQIRLQAKVNITTFGTDNAAENQALEGLQIQKSTTTDYVTWIRSANLTIKAMITCLKRPIIKYA